MAKDKKYSDEELDKYFSDKDYRKKKLSRNKNSTRFFITLSLIILIAVGIFAGYLIYLSNGLPSLSDLENPKLEEATKIYSSDG